jgi:SAM-dependent methyltransferase
VKPWRHELTRRRFGARLLRGDGLEIGALHNPFPAPRRARVRFVDRHSTPQLREEYPELAALALVDVDVVDDGETLASVPDASQDFVIASHFLEHTEDPIGTIAAHLRVLRPGGTLLLALPDRRETFDRHREGTPLEHLVADHDEGPERSRAQHYEEWARLVDLPLGNVEAEGVTAHATDLQRRRYSIHFHCWTAEEFSSQLAEIVRRYALPAEVVAQRRNHHEFLAALRRV